MAGQLAIVDKNPIDQKARLNYLGGTDAAGVLGLSRWATPLSVWAEKTGAVVREDRGSIQMILGKRLEHVVAELFMEATGKKVVRVNETLFHPKWPFLGANIDRRVVGEDAIFEAKTASAYKSAEWDGDEIPREYLIQCMHYLAVTGKKRCYLAVLIGNQNFQWKVIERDEKLLTDMVVREVAFWNGYVVTNIMPKMVTKYDADTLDALYPRAVAEKEIELSDEANILVENLQGFKADARNLEGLIDQTENQLKQLLGDANSGSTSLNKVSWINTSRSGLDVDRLKTELPDVYAKYYRSRPARRFTVRPIKGATI